MPSSHTTEIELRLLIEAIYLHYSQDFRDYAPASLKRRVLHAQQQLKHPTISNMQEKILLDPQAFGQLLALMTVSVSDMFRDASYFLALRRHVVPVLKTNPPSRFGWPAAAPARRCIRWPSCCAKRACWSVPSSKPPTSTRPRWNMHAGALSRWSG